MILYDNEYIKMDFSEVRKTLCGLYKQLDSLYQSFAD